MNFIATISLPVYAPYEFEQIKFKKKLYARDYEELHKEVELLKKSIKPIGGMVVYTEKAE